MREFATRESRVMRRPRLIIVGGAAPAPPTPPPTSPPRRRLLRGAWHIMRLRAAAVRYAGVAAALEADLRARANVHAGVLAGPVLHR